MPRQKKNPVQEVTSEDVYAGLSTEGENAFLADLLDQATDLAKEKEALQGRITANREAVRMVVKTGLLSEVQAKAASIFYPDRTKAADNGETPTADASADAS